jgi:hypothetical protein
LILFDSWISGAIKNEQNKQCLVGKYGKRTIRLWLS